MPTTAAHTIIELDFKDADKEEVQLPEQLIKDYQDLNEKLEETLVKIKRKQSSRKTKTNLKK